jgi:O-antigen/teichoic acid export membrane protein
MVVVAFLLFSDQGRLALLVLIATAAGMHLAQTPRMILTRRVMHRRLALLQLLDALLTAVVSLGLASRGITLWALLASNIVTLFLNIVLLYVWRPVWRPRFAWSSQRVRYFLRFGSSNLVSAILAQALDRVDDLWAGFMLGETSLGFYSRAYRFATYPRSLLADPIRLVAAGTYAELKDDRKRLSKSFVRTNAFLVRTGFFLGGLIALVAPEFIRLALGEKWLPMLDAFRLMLVFTLFDPMQATVANLFVVMGKPEQVVKIRSVQLAVMVAGLFLLGRPLGIAGVALAVNAMLVVGIVTLLWQARTYVDFSLRHLFAAPSLALVFGLGLAYKVGALPRIVGSDWWTGFVKIIAFSISYGAVLAALEHRQLREWFSVLIRYLFQQPGG